MEREMIFVMVFIIALTAIVLGVGSNIYKRHLEYKEKQMTLLADKTAEKAAQYVAQIGRMEQRMRVLERIATDRGAELAMEIEDLRGKSDDEGTMQ